MSAADDMVVIERPRDDIAILRLNRPDRLNALSFGMVEAIHDALDTIDLDPVVRVLILTGAGRGFCSGLDLKDFGSPRIVEGLKPPGSGMRAQAYIGQLVPHLRRIQQPVIAAINGPAYGGGLALACGCDVRVAARSARFSVQAVRLGVSAGEMGMSFTLPKLIGASRAHELMLTARDFDTEEAERIGLVARVVDDDQVVDAAMAIAETICSYSPFGVVMTKQVLWANLNAPSLEVAQHLEDRTQILAGTSGDMAEAAAAFREKRPPQWSS